MSTSSLLYNLADLICAALRVNKKTGTITAEAGRKYKAANGIEYRMEGYGWNGGDQVWYLAHVKGKLSLLVRVTKHIQIVFVTEQTWGLGKETLHRAQKSIATNCTKAVYAKTPKTTTWHRVDELKELFRGDGHTLDTDLVQRFKERSTADGRATAP